MRSILAITVLLTAGSFSLPAQVDTTGDIVQGVIVVKKKTAAPSFMGKAAAGGGTDCIGCDTAVAADNTGMNNPLRPYVKVDYSLYLCDVKEVPVIRDVDGYPYRDKVPVFDSAVFPSELQRIYPRKTVPLSKYFSDHLTYKYSPADSAQVDTLIVGLWIDSKGKIRWAETDTTNTGELPPQVVDELREAVAGLTKWGTGGGYKTRRRLFHPSRFFMEDYYCELRIVVSAQPVTNGQKNTGTYYTLFDFPLNSPTTDIEQEAFVRKNNSLKTK